MPEKSPKPITFTIGTAGHVDHGKTTLVRYMTGTDTDRLEEEHRRGISIVPGYAELDLPTGVRASLVDVPGHERFVKNMVAGSTGVDAFLLVVAADDGVMPQTREHLDVLRVLGIESGAVALTKVDAVDDEMVELAQLDVVELLESAGIEAEVLPVSGATGAGVDELKRALGSLASNARSGRPGRGIARLPVDRSFVLKGIGVVATGTLWSGEIRTGDTLYSASGHRPKVRGVQNHGRPADVAHAGARTALDLTNIEASEIEAGDTLLSRPISPVRSVDARLRLIGGSAPLRHGHRVRLHHGTQDTNVRVRLLDRKELHPGEDALARLRLEEPLVVLTGDRFVLRSLAPQITIGGGTVLDAAPSGRRPEPGWLEALESKDPARIVPLLLARSPGEGMTAEDLSLALDVAPENIPSELENIPEVARIGGLYARLEELEPAKDRLLDALKRREKERPESPELTTAEARTALGLTTRLADAVLNKLSAGQSAEIVVTGSGVSLPDGQGVPPELEEEAAELYEKLRQAGTEPPVMENTPAMRLLLKRKEAVDLGGALFGSGEAAEAVLEQIKTVCREKGDISLSGLRDRLGTSRKYAQAWLEYSDTVGVTRRTGDVRALTRRYR
ncbi:MAG: selenocysteine-specific translation elongation factor [Rubrobacteraceae bacterium]